MKSLHGGSDTGKRFRGGGCECLLPDGTIHGGGDAPLWAGPDAEPAEASGGLQVIKDLGVPVLSLGASGGGPKVPAPLPSGGGPADSYPEIPTANLDTDPRDPILVAGQEFPAGLARRGETTRCSPCFRVESCACGDNVIPYGGCLGSNCETCAEFVGKRRAAAVLARLEAGLGGRPLLQTILTVPAEYREAASDPKVWGRWRRTVARLLKRRYGFDFGLESSHPCGDEGGPERFHPHENWLWVQRPGFRPYLDVDDLRKRIAKALRWPVARVNVRHSWVRKLAKVRHRVRYVVRSFPGWGAWLGTRARWYGKYPRNPEPADREYVCGKCGEKPHLRGYVSKDVGETWLRMGRPDGYLGAHLCMLASTAMAVGGPRCREPGEEG